MNAAWLASVAGGFLICLLISRGFHYLFRDWPKFNSRALVASGMTFAVAVVAGGIGMADGGAPAFGRSAMVYFPACLLVLLFDLTITARKFPKP